MRPFFAAGLVVIAGLFSQACLFGGGDDPEPTPTTAPPVSTPTPSAAEETPTPDSATATPAGDDATPTLDPSAATEYIVQAGDFLSVIAAKFDITVEALAAANGIDDPDKIFVGQVLIIPPRE
jgi:LysM repeat protein